jgi:glyoxylase-like metal-dependent hydrolase (beta-lactamase superfamily II)
MDLIRLTENAYHLRAGSNAGLLVSGRKALLVDSGLDRDAARRILKHVAALQVEVAAIVITHAHADHFGGAGELKRRAGRSAIREISVIRLIRDSDPPMSASRIATDYRISRNRKANRRAHRAPPSVQSVKSV